MKKEEIENKDKELIKKFRTIIDNKKKQREAEEKNPPKKSPMGFISLLVILIISGGLFFFRSQPVEQPSMVAKQPSLEKSITAAQQQPERNSIEVTQSPGASTVAPEKSTPLPEKLTAAPPVQEIVEKQPAPKASGTDLMTPDLQPPDPEPEPDLTEPTAPVEIASSQDKAIIPPPLPVKTAIPETKTDMPVGIQIEKILSCSSVRSRQAYTPQTQFSLSRHTKTWVWMNVLSETPPFTLTHVYYCNGVKYCEVPLAISYSRMRTWSRIRLRSQDQIGQWRVEVIDDNGVKLAQVEFTVAK